MVVFSASSPIDEAQLAAWVRESQPTWDSYQEDIKGQLGARAAAQWQGEFVEARHTAGDSVEIVFKVVGPWATRDVAMPILVRDPELGVTRLAETTAEGALRIYHLTLDGAEAPPWLEVQYPHHTRRVPLSRAS